jgi:RNA polymerase sigma-70 factor (ECF subfamily)
MATVTQYRREAPPAAAAILGAPSLESVVQEYSHYVATIGFRILGRRNDLEDLLQDVFLEAHRNLHTLRDPQALRAWLATVTVRAARRMLRARRITRLLMPLGAAPAFDPIDRGASAEERHIHSRVYTALDRLPANVRIAWTLKVLQGEPLDRIAEMCGCSVAAVKRRIAKADEVLDRELSHE